MINHYCGLQTMMKIDNVWLSKWNLIPINLVPNFTHRGRLVIRGRCCSFSRPSAPPGIFCTLVCVCSKLVLVLQIVHLIFGITYEIWTRTNLRSKQWTMSAPHSAICLRWGSLPDKRNDLVKITVEFGAFW